jgi:transposase-like protein
MTRKKPEVSRREELLSELAADCESPEEFMGLLNDLKKSLLEKALDAEMDQHLGYRKHESSGRGSGNSRNGRSKKTIQGEFGKAEISTPRDRNGSFEPKLVGKHQRRTPGFDQKVLALYAKGMTTRDIAQTMHELYEVEVSHDLISHVTEAVQSEVSAWQNRPLADVYPILFMDGLVVSVPRPRALSSGSAS